MITALHKIRLSMAKQKIDYLIVPHGDEFNNEYLPAYNERLARASGFTGSFGLAVIGMTHAHLFTDGRYVLQCQDELDIDVWDVHLWASENPYQWLANHVEKSKRVAMDPWTHSHREANLIEASATKVGAEILYLSASIIDATWNSRPVPLTTKAAIHGLEFAGVSTAEKIDRLSLQIKRDGVDAVVLTQADSICWLLNIRGREIPYNPLVLSYAILYADGKLDWFVSPDKTTDKVVKVMPDTVTVHLDTDFEAGLRSLTDKAVGLDSSSVPHAIAMMLEDAGAKVRTYKDPCAFDKACKNSTEIQGTHAAHLRDGVALVKFLHWLDAEAPKETLTEIAAADKLEALRAENDSFKGLSFPTISGVGPNGAVVHYKVDASSNRPLKKNDIYLVDSGAQYLDGTTDITRTIFLGDVCEDPEIKDRYTRVLKGHIALGAARFPVSTTGGALDSLARQFLWQIGEDYAHGTGHGVGSYLCVHEAPQRISKKGADAPLKPGMILSNEPGFYKEDFYGIRLENLVLVTESDQEGWLKFEQLTWAPFDKRLIEQSLLTSDEIDWIDAYHAEVKEKLAGHLKEDQRAWLDAATRSLLT